MLVRHEQPGDGRSSFESSTTFSSLHIHHKLAGVTSIGVDSNKCVVQDGGRLSHKLIGNDSGPFSFVSL